MDAAAIGKRLKDARVKTGKSLHDVSMALDISKSALAMYEIGKRIPRDNVKVKLAAFYGVSVEALFFAA